MNYLLFYRGRVPDYVNYTLDSILKIEDKHCKVYFCGDDKLNRNDIVFINRQDINSEMINEVINKNYFKNETNPLWESSLLRIFYLYELANRLKIDNFVHFDCDVLIYEPFCKIKNLFEKDKLNITPVNEFFLNFSYSYIDNIQNFKFICMCLLDILENSEHYEKKYYSGSRLNEMIMLNIAYIKNPNLFNLLKTVPNGDGNYIFDPGTYGQYLGGIDKRLFSKKEIFPDHYVGRNIDKFGYKIKFEKGFPAVSFNDKKYKLVNLHVHKKNNLGKFILN